MGRWAGAGRVLLFAPEQERGPLTIEVLVEDPEEAAAREVVRCFLLRRSHDRSTAAWPAED